MAIYINSLPSKIKFRLRKKVIFLFKKRIILDSSISYPRFILKDAKLSIFIRRFFLDKWVVRLLPKINLHKYVHSYKAHKIRQIPPVDDLFLYIFQ